MEDKVIFKVNVLDDVGELHFNVGNEYRLILADDTGYYISKEKRGNVCSHFPVESLGDVFEIIR